LVYGFIHHLRNAIAHAHFEFKDPNAFEFWDQEKDTETYRARLSLEAMERFLEVVGRLMAYHDESPGVS